MTAQVCGHDPERTFLYMPWSKPCVCFLSELPIHPSKLSFSLNSLASAFCIKTACGSCLSSALCAALMHVEHLLGDENYCTIFLLVIPGDLLVVRTLSTFSYGALGLVNWCIPDAQGTARPHPCTAAGRALRQGKEFCQSCGYFGWPWWGMGL